MIIFAKEKFHDQCYHNWARYTKVAISGNIEMFNSSVEDGANLIPPPDVISHFLKDGDKSALENDYHRYLSDPRIFYPLLLRVHSAADEPVFFMYSNMDKEMKYPKMLKRFIIENIGIGKEYVVDYDDISEKKMLNRKYDSDTRKELTKMIKSARDKFAEAVQVLDEN